PGTRLIVLDGASSGRQPGTSLPVAAVSAIGRDLDNEIVLADPTVSGRHAVVNLRDGAWWIEDLGSTNGTYLNGAAIVPGRPAISRSGDTIRVGAVRLRLVTPEL
ncbi:MAG: FHA domain-containing protein, partial [Anaerolineae bacterium]